jgi:hypothetical protein
MATVYKFIVEARAGQGITDVDGHAIAVKGAGVKSSTFTAHNRGGTEHNRYMRPINPLMNRVTGGYWEKGMRVGRAAAQLPNDIAKKGIGAVTGVASLILVQFAIMEIDKYFREQRKKAKEENQNNFLKQKSGESVLSGNYTINRNFFGKVTYDQMQGVGARLR